ncbi:MAG TPA: TerC family protein [Phycisphaerales bacterium]|nr:TerC family protein [Phycisphaerales bacterium]
MHMLLTLAETAPAAGAQAGMTGAIIALVTLTAMEIVLGIDNIVFIAILCARLPEKERNKARVVGLALAMITRVLLLLGITWIMSLSKTALFTLPVLNHELTGKDLVLLLGGLFLIYKATKEIHGKVEGSHEDHKTGGVAKFWPVIGQIIIIDIVFSLDSVITAVGMANQIWVMVTAVIVAVLVMLLVSGRIASFIDRHPTVKMLALAFLLLIGVMLVADGLGQHVPKGYIYFAMAFSLGVEVLNMVVRGKHTKPA